MAKVTWDMNELFGVVGEAAQPRIESVVEKVTASANAMGGNFHTGLYHRDHESPAVGNTPARYAGDVNLYHGSWPVGIVHTDNYAAMRDTLENNTLLKALG